MERSELERLKGLHDLLMEDKRRLWNELRSELFEKLGQDLHTQYDMPRDIGEQSILDLLDETGLGVADLHREQLTRLEEALVRLETGSYGICEECGRKIDEARLRVVPYATCCLSCQEGREKTAAPARKATL